MMKGKYMPVSYNWLQSFFGVPLPAPQELAELLTNSTFEIEDMVTEAGDTALDVKVLPDRAADSFSHRGIAKEIGALLQIPLTYDPLSDSFPVRMPLSNEIRLANTTSTCRAHNLALVKGVTVGPSPKWLKERLEIIGQRSINNVVDATNYVMFELGQPTHVFDWNKLTLQDGTRGILVRNAHKGEKVSLLGGEEKELRECDAVLADVHSDIALDIAGVKGGMVAELDATTTDVLITSANFDPSAIRITSRDTGVATDASRRFKNGIAPELSVYGIARVASLLQEIAGGTLAGYAHFGVEAPEKKYMQAQVTKINNLLGTTISEGEMEELIASRGLTATRAGDILTVEVPFERRDLTIWQDIVEEVARAYGYSRIPETPLPKADIAPEILMNRATAEYVRVRLTTLGFHEIYAYTLRKKGKVSLMNPLSDDKRALRANLTDGIQEALVYNAHNAPLLNMHEEIRLFEIGSVFPSEQSEAMHVAIGTRVLTGKNKEAREITSVTSALTALGVTTITPTNGVVEIALDSIPQTPTASYETGATIAQDTVYAPISTFPFILRDIALWVPQGTSEDAVLTIIKKHGDPLVRRIDKFDEFAKEGRTSLAFHIVFQSFEKTLTDEEVGVIMHKVETECRTFGLEVR